MQTVGVDATSTCTPTSGTTVSWTHTPVGTPTLALVGVSQETDTTGPSSVTYGGTTMGLVRGDNGGTVVRTSIFSLVNPLSGARTVSVTFAATHKFSCGAMTFTNTRAVASGSTASGTTVNPAVSGMSIPPNGLALAVLAIQQTTAPTAVTGTGATATSRWGIAGDGQGTRCTSGGAAATNECAAGATIPNPGTAVTWTDSNAVQWVISTVNIADPTWDGGGVDNNWNTCANWTLDTCPVASDAVVFDATSTKAATVNIATPALGSLSINAGYTNTVTVSINQTATWGTVTLAAGTLSTAGFSVTFGSLVMTAAGGTLTLGASTVTMNGSVNIPTGGGTLNAGTSTFVAATTATWTGHSGSNNDNLFYNVTVNTGVTVTVVSGLHVNNILTMNGTATVTGSTLTFPIANTNSTPLSRSGSDTISNSSVDWALNVVSSTIPAGTYGGAFQISRGQTATLGGNVTVTGNLTINANDSQVTLNTSAANNYSLTVGSLTIGATEGNHRILANNSVVTVSGAVDITATSGFIVFGGSSWTVSGNWTNASTNASWDAGTSTVTFNAAGAQTVGGAGTRNIFATMAVSGGQKNFTASFTTSSITVSTALTMRITAGVTWTHSGANLGTLGTILTLTSSAGGSAWNLTATSAATTAFSVNVADSNASSSTATINACDPSNLDSGGNSNWNFSGTPGCGSSTTGGGNRRIYVVCSLSWLLQTVDCVDYSGYGTAQITSVNWFVDGQFRAETGKNATVRLPTGDTFLNAGSDIRHEVVMELVLANGGHQPNTFPVTGDYSPRLLLFGGVAAVFVVILAVLIRRRGNRSIFFPRVKNPSYRRTAVETDEYPRGWVSYRQQDPSRYSSFRTRVLRKDARGNATVVAVFGLRPATPAERARTGRTRIAELQTVRERMR